MEFAVEPGALLISLVPSVLLYGGKGSNNFEVLLVSWDSSGMRPAWRQLSLRVACG